MRLSKVYEDVEHRLERKDDFVDGKYSKDITSFSIYEIVSPKFTEGQIKTDKTKRIHNYGIPEQSHKLTVNESGVVEFSEKEADDE